MTTIVLSTEIPAGPEEAFDLSIDVDVHTGSMAGSGERTIGGTRSGRLQLGDTVTFTARHFGLPWRMTSKITAYERPTRFVDEQVRGPFRTWRHEHTFAWDAERGVTVAEDRIDFTAPFGIVGRVVDRLVLGRYMRRLIATRNEYLASVVSGSPPSV